MIAGSAGSQTCSRFGLRIAHVHKLPSVVGTAIVAAVAIMMLLAVAGPESRVSVRFDEQERMQGESQRLRSELTEIQADASTWAREQVSPRALGDWTANAQNDIYDTTDTIIAADLSSRASAFPQNRALQDSWRKVSKVSYSRRSAAIYWYVVAVQVLTFVVALKGLLDKSMDGQTFNAKKIFAKLSFFSDFFNIFFALVALVCFNSVAWETFHGDRFYVWERNSGSQAVIATSQDAASGDSCIRIDRQTIRKECQEYQDYFDKVQVRINECNKATPKWYKEQEESFLCTVFEVFCPDPANMDKRDRKEMEKKCANLTTVPYPALTGLGTNFYCGIFGGNGNLDFLAKATTYAVKKDPAVSFADFVFSYRTPVVTYMFGNTLRLVHSLLDVRFGMDVVNAAMYNHLKLLYPNWCLCVCLGERFVGWMVSSALDGLAFSVGMIFTQISFETGCVEVTKVLSLEGFLDLYLGSARQMVIFPLYTLPVCALSAKCRCCLQPLSDLADDDSWCAQTTCICYTFGKLGRLILFDFPVALCMVVCGWLLFAFTYATYMESFETVQEPKPAAVAGLIFSWLGLLTGLLGICHVEEKEEEEKAANADGGGSSQKLMASTNEDSLEPAQP